MNNTFLLFSSEITRL